MKNKFLLGILCILVIILCSMKCTKERCSSILVAHHVLMQLKKGGVDLPDSVKKGVKLFYYVDTDKRYLNELKIIDMPTNLNYMHGKVLDAPYIGDFSATKNIKNYYLEYANGNIDTLFLDNQIVSCEDGLKDICTCVYPVKNFNYNGKLAKLDTSVKWEIIWILDKP